ncbi:MAG: CTP synthase (glutamine hydrolyzing) [archaeon]
MPKLKWIVVTGGVLSGIGKGIAAASIGHILSSKYKVIPIKCDGYLNTDPGTMNPIEHGEVFVLEDGGEVDMDFGHYERFLGVDCKFEWNLTMGKIFNAIRIKERRGDYLGKTVQYVPHVTDLIQDWYFRIAKKEKADVMIIEIGGTVGDLENELFLESIRQLEKKVGHDNILYVHLTYVPIPINVNEQKSKPTQQSVNLLRQRGIQPNIIIGRCSEFLKPHIKEKIAMFCNVNKEDVITGLDVNNIYKIPIIFSKEGINKSLEKKLKLDIPPNMKKWGKLVDNMEHPDKEVTIAICGKYTRLEDSYASIIESLNHCGAHFKAKINLKWLETTDIKSVSKLLEGVNGVIVPGGFGSRGTEGKIEVIKECREKGIPFLGICYGLQLAVAEYARHVCGLKGANSTEIDPKTKYPVIDILPEQKKITKKGGTMRLGGYPAILKKGTVTHSLYKQEKVSERHRHRYEVNPEYHEILEKNGLIFSGMSPDRKLVEFIELKNHPYFVATQAHPELKSKLEAPAPLFYGLIRAAVKKKE